jgi:hypothetical protein
MNINGLNPWNEPPDATWENVNMGEYFANRIYEAAAELIKSSDTKNLKQSLQLEINDFNNRYKSVAALLIALMKVAIQYQNIQAVQILLDNGYNKTWHINYNEDGYTMVTAHKAAEIQRDEYKETGYAWKELDTIIKLLKPSEGGKRKSRRNKRKNNKSRKQHSRRR